MKEERPVQAELIVRNGVIYPRTGRRQAVSALASWGGRVVAVGDDQDVMVWKGPNTQVMDLAGRVVLPGLIDSHLHLLNLGQALSRLDLSAVTSVADLKQAVKERAEEIETDWILGRGWEQGQFIEERYPLRTDLDEVAPHRPVFLKRACGHVAVASSQALQLAGVDAQTPDPPGGIIDRGEDGQPTGVLRETAMSLVEAVVPASDSDDMMHALVRGAKAALAAGITGVHSNDSFGGTWEAGWELYRQALRELPFRVYWDVPISHLDEVLASPLRTGDGDDRVRLGAMKIFVDGSLGGSTALLSEPYHDDPSNRGVMIPEEDQLHELVLRSHAGGMQVAIHAIGDRAIELALDAIAYAQATVPRPSRHRIIHCQIMRPELFKRFGELGVVADIQPKFITTDMRWTESRIGPERTLSSYAWKTFLEHGVVLSGGSDAPVEPLFPWWGIYAAVARQNMEGNPAEGWFNQQALSVEEAMDAFTVGSAYAAGEEQVKGTLTPGKLTDAVVVDADPFNVSPARLKDMRVLKTLVGGEVVYADDE